MSTTHRLSFLLADADAHETAARLREMKVVTALLCGWRAPVTIAIDAALAGGSAAVALREIDALPALRRRRVLSCIGALMKGARQ